MSTITKELAKLFRKITNSEIDAEGNAHVVLSPADSLLINNARMALSVEGQEPVYQVFDEGGGWFDIEKRDISREKADGNQVRMLYAAPQPVAVPDDDEFEKAFLSWNPDKTGPYVKHQMKFIWNACRAAMLQAGNSPVIQDGSADMLGRWLSFGRGMQSAGSQLPHNLIAETESMLAAAPQSPGSEPATVPGKWIPVSERTPETDGNYWGWWSESKRQGPVWFIKSELQAQFQSSEITHWMPLPAAPQEVKGE